MTTTAQTWFYTQPEGDAYAISERVRTTLWEARLGDLWLDVVRTESPHLMRGRYDGSEVEMEWEAGHWLALRTCPASSTVADRIANVLGFKPVLTYQTPEGWTVWEWHTDGGDKRWQAIQGIPAYLHPQRLNRA